MAGDCTPLCELYPGCRCILTDLAPLAAPAARSLVSGAIGRSVVDAAAAYSDRLADLWRQTLEAGWP